MFLFICLCFCFFNDTGYRNPLIASRLDFPQKVYFVRQNFTVKPREAYPLNWYYDQKKDNFFFPLDFKTMLTKQKLTQV